MEKNDGTHPVVDAIKEWFVSKFNCNDTIVSATDAYFKSTYGTSMNVERLIKFHQTQINHLINNKTSYRTDGDTFGDYFCMYSFPNNIVPYIDDILQPFKDKGYCIINLSERVEEFKNYNVYSLSWIKDTL